MTGAPPTGPTTGDGGGLDEDFQADGALKLLQQEAMSAVVTTRLVPGECPLFSSQDHVCELVFYQ